MAQDANEGVGAEDATLMAGLARAGRQIRSRQRVADHGEVFTEPPPPPAPYQKRKITESLGKSLLIDGPGGAVAYIGCNTGGQPCALTLLDGFISGLARSSEPRLGDCWIHAISYYYDKEHLATLKPNNDWYPPSIFFQGMKYMLYGDPTLPLAQPAQKPASG